MIKRHTLFFISLAGWFVLNFTDTQSLLFAGNDNLIVKIDNIRRDLVVESFGLTKDMRVRIEGNAAVDSRGDHVFAHPWILDADTRKLAWQFNFGRVNGKHSSDKLEIYDEVLLHQGNYEVYYAFSPSIKVKIKKLGDVVKGLFTGFEHSAKFHPSLGIAIYAAEGEADMHYVTNGKTDDDAQAIVQLIKSGDDAYQQQGFSLNQSLNLRVYAIGEGSKKEREMYDYGWIIDAHSRNRVWEMDPRKCQHAGGATKNLMFDELINLPAGDYIAYYVTDKNHSYDAWNAMPPYDPKFWGLTIWGTGVDYSNTMITVYEERESNVPIVELTKMRNDEYENGGFSLVKPTKLRIYALGEYSYSDRCMADYGWIENARTRERVWEMRYRETQHAGGGRKNRLFDGVISLPEGDYVVYYITDDSHSFRDWNVGPPYNPEAWGISIWGAGEDFSREDIRSYRETEDPDLLVQIIRIGDDEYIKEKFTLNHRCRIRIYSIGEGDRYEMYDYAWIEDEEGDTVWKMKYSHTDHAGGARKNRVFDDTITLPRGTYYAGYRTDDSHSYRNWNTTPPKDPVHWGITITAEE
ncbi:hypothetical protein JXJ21_10865 [candidate division KSB1 bacterium]|nr:hypothetical protein [candidate division KSB1 bacterium]